MPLKNLPAGESPLHLWTHDFIQNHVSDAFLGDGKLRLLLFFLRISAPGFIRLFPAFGSGRHSSRPRAAFSGCSGTLSVRCARNYAFLDLQQGLHPAPVVSRFLYRLTPATVCRTQFFAAIWGVFLLVFLCVCGEAGIFFALPRKLTQMFAAVFGVWVCCTLLFAA